LEKLRIYLEIRKPLRTLKPLQIFKKIKTLILGFYQPYFLAYLGSIGQQNFGHEKDGTTTSKGQGSRARAVEGVGSGVLSFYSEEISYLYFINDEDIDGDNIFVILCIAYCHNTVV